MQHAAPLLEGLVGREDHRATLEVALVDDVEEHVRGVVAVCEVAHLVDDEHVGLHVLHERLAQTALSAGAREVVDELGSCHEARVEAELDGSVGDGDGQVRLPSTRPAVEHDVLPLGEEVRREHRAEHRDAQGRLEGEVEVVDRLQEGEAGVASDAGQTSLLSLGDFLREEHLEQVLVGPVFLLGARAEVAPGAASVREVKALQHGVDVDGAHWRTASPSKLICSTRSSRS